MQNFWLMYFIEMNGGRQQGINLNFQNKNSINYFEIKK